MSVPSLPPPDVALLGEVGSDLDLREPNERAVRTIAQRLHEHYGSGSTTFFEAVVASATGMGKSYVISGAMEYFARLGVRNFAVVTPGKAIQTKTINQFTENHAKSLVEEMEHPPLVVHADNFNSPAMANDFEDDAKIKLYVFTVQSLIRPKSEQGRKTHTYTEGLGSGFYAHLEQLEDLIVFADEHHCYGGPAFSKTVRGLHPLALIGLTATPAEKMMEKSGIPCIFRYPLAAAIKGQFVKTPVIVGRKDDNKDWMTQLADGGKLLQKKERDLHAYAASGAGRAFIQPMMLVNCPDIAEAERVEAHLRSSEYFDGKYAGENVVLRIDSSQGEDALGALDRVEDTDSPTRVIVQVGMLKEGWDVKNVYVIVTLRASTSEILTEQTIGRGLRLPFGTYVEEEGCGFLNELEIVAHDRYFDLLKKAGALRQTLIDYETVIEETPAGTQIREVQVDLDLLAPGLQSGAGAPRELIDTVEDRVASSAPPAPKTLEPDPRFAPLMVPVVKTELPSMQFSLGNITDLDPFRELGQRLASGALDETLLRKALHGEEEQTGIEGVHTFGLVEGTAEEMEAAAPVVSEEEGFRRAIALVMGGGDRPVKRAGEVKQAERLLNATLQRLDVEARKSLLIHYPDRIALHMKALITKERTSFFKQLPRTREVTRFEEFTPRERKASSHPEAPSHREWDAAKDKGKTDFGPWRKRSLFAQNRFDSGPERDIALLLEDAKEVDVWVRLLRDELAIEWGSGRRYNPDFLVRDTDGQYWLVEIKGKDRLTDEEVVAKRDAALKWVNAINGHESAPSEWHYLFVPEGDVKAVRESWPALVAACSN
jgi:type III restriction enzyme